MKRYVVTLEKEERDKLAGITRKGSHQSQKMLNALILLNCDEGEFVATWQASRDRVQAKVNGQLTTDDARVKLKLLYPTLYE